MGRREIVEELDAIIDAVAAEAERMGDVPRLMDEGKASQVAYGLGVSSASLCTIVDRLMRLSEELGADE